uniref:Uncharacterized protein n=1 Tax=Romanomermis culicivorax TaxID=13658 RepID=A0A915II44_ROMCU
MQDVGDVKFIRGERTPPSKLELSSSMWSFSDEAVLLTVEGDLAARRVDETEEGIPRFLLLLGTFRSESTNRNYDKIRAKNKRQRMRTIQLAKDEKTQRKQIVLRYSKSISGAL